LNSEFIEDVIPEKMEKKFPRAKSAWEEKITFELKPGETVFIPSFMWFQLQWPDGGISVCHSGIADSLTPDQQSAIELLSQTWEIFFFCFYSVPNYWKEQFAIWFLSLGRHPSGILSGAPVSFSFNPNQACIISLTRRVFQHGSWKSLSAQISARPKFELLRMHSPTEEEWANRPGHDNPVLLTGILQFYWQVKVTSILLDSLTC
jgi:hypothetical protein